MMGLVSAGCWCGSPHVAGAPSVPPDEQIRTGGAHGYDLFVWTCVDAEHVVVSQESGEMFCASAQVERVPCGRKTTIETKVEKERQSRRPIDRW